MCRFQFISKVKNFIKITRICHNHGLWCELILCQRLRCSTTGRTAPCHVGTRQQKLLTPLQHNYIIQFICIYSIIVFFLTYALTAKHAETNSFISTSGIARF